MTISQYAVQGEQSRDYAAGTVSFVQGEGFEHLSEWCEEAYPEFYDDVYTGYRGNHSSSEAINRLIEGFDPSEEVSPFESVETEPLDNQSGYRLSVALSPDALENLRTSLENSEYSQSVRFGSALQNHLKRVIQHLSLKYTDFTLDDE